MDISDSNEMKYSNSARKTIICKETSEDSSNQNGV